MQECFYNAGRTARRTAFPFANGRTRWNERRTTDYTDFTDKEGIGVQGVYTRRVAATQAKGLLHTSPGQRPGFIVQQVFCCRPKACFIEFDERYVWD